MAECTVREALLYPWHGDERAHPRHPDPRRRPGPRPGAWRSAATRPCAPAPQGSGARQVLAPVVMPTRGPASASRAAVRALDRRQGRRPGHGLRASETPARRQDAARQGQPERLSRPWSSSTRRARWAAGSGTASGWRCGPTAAAAGCREGELAFYTTSVEDRHRPLGAQAQRVPSRRARGHVPGGRRQAGAGDADRLLLRQPEAEAAVARRRLRRARHRHQRLPAEAPRTGRRAGRWRSTAPTRTT